MASEKTSISSADGKGWFRKTVLFKEHWNSTAYSPGTFPTCDVFIQSGTKYAIGTRLSEERFLVGEFGGSPAGHLPVFAWVQFPFKEGIDPS